MAGPINPKTTELTPRVVSLMASIAGAAPQKRGQKTRRRPTMSESTGVRQVTRCAYHRTGKGNIVAAKRRLVVPAIRIDERESSL